MSNLEVALSRLPFSLIEIRPSDHLEEQLSQVLDVLDAASIASVREDEFMLLVAACESWGFQAALYGEKEAVAATLSQRLRETGASRVGWARSLPFGDVALQRIEHAGLTDRCRMLLADSSAGPVFVFALARRADPREDEPSEWWLAGHGLTELVVRTPARVSCIPKGREPANSTSQEILRALAGDHEPEKSRLLNHISAMSSEERRCLVASIFRVLDRERLCANWNWKRAGGYGVALALCESHCIDDLVGYGKRHEGDIERHVWVNRVLGEIKRRRPRAAFPGQQTSNAVNFLLNSLRSNQPSASVAWSAAESLGLFGAASKKAIPVLSCILNGNHRLDPRVLRIYQTSLRKILGASEK